MTDQPIESPNWSFRQALEPGINALKNHWRPIVAIQVAAIALVIVYHNWEAMRLALRSLEAFKVSKGLPFSFIAGAIAGGLVPEIAKLATGALKKFDNKWLGKTAYVALVFGLVGILVDVFYQGQGMLFGNGVDALTLAKKTFVDMGLFAPLFCIPFELAVLQWPQNRYRVMSLFQNFSPKGYRENALPAMLPCWGFWIPVLVCVYAMPKDLQFCLAMLAEAAWSIILVFVATEEPQQI